MATSHEFETESKTSVTERSSDVRPPGHSAPSLDTELPHTLSQQQHRWGNQALQHLLSERIQSKLRVSQPDDKHEREADRVSNRVIRMSESETASLTFRGKASTGRDVGRCPSCQARYVTGNAPDCKECKQELKRTETTPELPAVDGGTHRQIGSLMGSGQSLPETLRSYFEPRFGVDFGNVRVHTGSRADTVAQAMNAKAFTLGRNVVFSSGAYRPNAPEGRRLLAHELTHIVQQRRPGARAVAEVGRNGYGTKLEPREEAGALDEGEPVSVLYPANPDRVHRWSPWEFGSEVASQISSAVESGIEYAGEVALQVVARQEWDAYPRIHPHFRNGFESYRELRPHYLAAGIDNPAKYLDDNIIQVRFLGHGTPVHRDLRQPLANAEATLGNNPPDIARFWGFVPRLTASGNLSNHALGRAVDIDSTENPFITSDHDIRVIWAVTGVDLGQRQNAQTMRNASQEFQNEFGDEWVSQRREELEELENTGESLSQDQVQRRQELQRLLRSVAARRDRLDEYAREGFLNLDQTLIDALTGAGFEWGGEWRTVKDFMHFEID